MKRVRNIIAVLTATIVVIVALFVAMSISNPDKKVLPEVITAESVCPVAGCASSQGCHAADDYPELDEGDVMVCPSRTGCTSTECHAIDRVTDTSRNATSVSLYFWIVGLTLITVIAVALVRK